MAGRFGVVAAMSVAACGRIDFGTRATTAGDAAHDSTSDGSSAGFCAGMPNVTFCRDFDEGNGTSDWQFTSQQLGSFQIDSSEARSMPASLQVGTNPVMNGQSADIALEEDSIGTVNRVTASFAVFIDAPGTNDAALFNISMDDGSELHELEIVTRSPPQPGYVEDANTPNGGTTTIDSFPTAALTVGLWHDVKLDFQSGAAAHVTLTYDGTTVLDTPPTFTTGGDANIYTGITYLAGPAAPWGVHIDNIAVTVTP